MNEILFAITSIDSVGETVLLSKKLEIVTLKKQPFYQSYENARKASVKMKNETLKDRELVLHWKDQSQEVLNQMDSGDIEFNEALQINSEKMIKKYYDNLAFSENGFSIVEVRMSI